LGYGFRWPWESRDIWRSSGVEGRCHGNQFGRQFAINGFVGYNFGCMIASDTLFDSRGGCFGVKLSDEDIAEIKCLRVVAIATNFGTKIAISWLCVNASD